MNRYLIQLPDTTLSLYYETKKKAQQAYPNATITLDTDKTYLEYIDKIIAASSTIGTLPYGSGAISYRFFKDGEHFLDGMEYVDMSKHRYVYPILKTIISPKDFYDKFVGSVPDCDKNFARFNKKQFTKLNPKPIKFCKLHGVNYYADAFGRLYEFDCSISNKKYLEEWNKFHDEPDAICVNFCTGLLHRGEVKWYHTEADMLTAFKKESDTTPSFCQTPEYQILHRGFKRKHPDLVENYIKLPYYPIKNIPVNERNASQVVLSWCEKLREIPYYRKVVDNCEWQNEFEMVITKYWEWVDKEKTK